MLVLGLRTSFVPAATEERTGSAVAECVGCAAAHGSGLNACQVHSSCTFDVALVRVYKIYLYHPKPFYRYDQKILC